MIRPESLNRKENKRILNTGGNIGETAGTIAGNFIPGLPPGVGSMVGGTAGRFLGNLLGRDKEPQKPASKTNTTMGYKYGGKYKRHLKYNVGGSLPSAAQPIGQDAVRYDGPSHEQGGIPIDEMGNPTDAQHATAEVEGNETRQGDFIFSDELMIPGGEMSFAEAHQMLLEEGAGEEQIEQLAQMQEQVKQEQGIDNEGAAPMEQAPMPQQQPQGQTWGEQGMMKKGGKVPKYPFGGKQAPHQHINQKYNTRPNRGIPYQTPPRQVQPSSPIPTTGPKPSTPLSPNARYQQGQQSFQNRLIQDATDNPDRPYRQPEQPKRKPRRGSNSRRPANARTSRFASGAKRVGRFAGRAALPVTAGIMTYDGLMAAYGNDERDRRDNNIAARDRAQDRRIKTEESNRGLDGMWDPESRTSIMGLTQGSDRGQIPQTRQQEEDAKVQMQNVEAPANNSRGSNRPSAANNRPEDVIMEPSEQQVLYGNEGIGSREVSGETIGGGEVTADPVGARGINVVGGEGANEGRDWASIAQRALPSVVNAATAAFAPKPKETPKMQARTISERNPAFAAGRNQQAAGFRANPTQAGHAQYTQGINQLAAQEAQDTTRREQFNAQAETRADQFNIQNEVRDNERTAQDKAARIQMITRAIQDPLDQIAANRRGKDQMRATVAMAAASIENEVERANFLNQVLSLIEGGSEAEEAIEQARGRN